MEKIGELFFVIWNMSVTAGIMILLVIGVRQLLSRLPKAFSYGLWGIVGFRLLCPYSVPSLFSLLNLGIFRGQSQRGGQVVWRIPEALKKAESLAASGAANGVGQSGNPSAAAGRNAAVQGQLTGGAEAFAKVGGSVQGGKISGFLDGLEMREILALVWLAGIAVFLIYQYRSYRRLKKQVETAVRFGADIYECDRIQVPFVMGLVHPKIYLPFRLAEKERSYILLHEQYHIRRGDHLVKGAATLLLAVYWFQPLVWIAYHLMCKDMEMSCDEKVIRRMGNEVKAEYSRSLLEFAVTRRVPTAMPLAFGETAVKTRVRNVLHFRKIGRTGTAVALILCMLTAFVGCANGAEAGFIRNKSSETEENKVTERDISYAYAVGKDVRSFLIYKEWYSQGEMAGYEVIRAGEFGKEAVPERGEFRMKWKMRPPSDLIQADADFSLLFDGGVEAANQVYLKINGYHQIAEKYYLKGENRKEKIKAGEDIVLSAWSLGNAGSEVRAVPCEDFMGKKKQEAVRENDGTFLFHMVFSDKTKEELEKEYEVSAYVKRLFALKNAYAGDAAADRKILEEMGIPEMGDFTLALQTEKEPYAMRIQFQETPEDMANEAGFYYGMARRSIVILSLIENLEQVEWEYPIEGETRLWKFDRACVAEMSGESQMADAKNVAVSEKEIQETINHLRDVYVRWEEIVLAENGKWEAPDGTLYENVQYVVGTREGETYVELYQVLTNEETVTLADVEEALRSGGKSDKVYLVKEGKTEE